MLLVQNIKKHLECSHKNARPLVVEMIPIEPHSDSFTRAVFSWVDLHWEHIYEDIYQKIRM